MRYEHLSDDEVLSTVTNLAGSERGTVVRVISLIAEVEERRLHLRDAYSSIYDFVSVRSSSAKGKRADGCTSRGCRRAFLRSSSRSNPAR